MLTLASLNLILFVGLVLLMTTLTLLAVHRAGSANNELLSTSKRWTLGTGILIVLWLALTFILAKKGVAGDFSRFPSPFMMVLAGFTIFNVLLNAVSSFGKRPVDSHCTRCSAFKYFGLGWSTCSCASTNKGWLLFK